MRRLVSACSPTAAALSSSGSAEQLEDAVVEVFAAPSAAEQIRELERHDHFECGLADSPTEYVMSEVEHDFPWAVLHDQGWLGRPPLDKAQGVRINLWMGLAMLALGLLMLLWLWLNPPKTAVRQPSERDGEPAD